MGSCWVNVGSVLLALGVVTGLISLFAPYWYKYEFLGLKTSSGLWGDCNSVTDKCEFWFDNERVLKSKPDYFKATQALFTIGVICLTVAELIVICYACCQRCQGSIRITQCLIGLLVVSAVALGIAVTIYGAKTETTKNISQLFWAFYLAVVTAICAVVAAIIFLMESCTLRR